MKHNLFILIILFRLFRYSKLGKVDIFVGQSCDPVEKIENTEKKIFKKIVSNNSYRDII